MRESNAASGIGVLLLWASVWCPLCHAEFRPMYHVAAQVERPEALSVADMNGDGHPDLLVVSDDDHVMGWYANDGTGAFGPLQVVAESWYDVTGLSTADLDGDGDIDIVSSSVACVTCDGRNCIPYTTIVWYANDGAGRFAPAQSISIYRCDTQSLHVTDVDGDGDLDILYSAFVRATVSAGDPNSTADDLPGSAIGWYANDGSGRFDSLQTTTLPGVELQATHVADLDCDGHVDLLAVADGYEIVWFRNDGQGQFEDRRVVGVSAVEVNSLCTGDLNGDGSLDLLVASEGSWEVPSLTWYTNKGDGLFEPAQEIPGAVEYGDGYAVNVVDVDDDGDLDVVAVHSYCVLACTSTMTWYANDGAGQFAFKQIVAQAGEYESFSTLIVADLDGDADPDILAVDLREDQVRWFENGGLGYGPQVAIDTDLDSADNVSAADLDGDGDLDVLATGSAGVGVVWYENRGARQFGPRRVIGEQTSSVGRRPTVASVDWRRMGSADLDGDGDIDVLVSLGDGTGRDLIYWYENDGLGAFNLRPVSAPDDYTAPCVLTADLDGDGDLDVLGYGGLAIWYANDGSGRFGPMQVITKRSAENLSVADLDGDGDLDIVTTLTWYANDGTGQFGPEQVISTETDGVSCVRPADLDGDGDVDILIAAYRYYTGGNTIHHIAWYANDGAGRFGTIQEISSDVWAVQSIDTADLDGDGDLDVLMAAYYEDEVAWFKNNGTEGFGEKQVVFNRADGIACVHTADLDGDGDIDILSASSLDNTIALYDNE